MIKQNLFALLFWASRHWRIILSTLVVIILCTVIIGYKINSIVPGQNIFETQMISNLQSVPKPWERMVNSPYTTPAYFLGEILNDKLLAARLISAFFALLAAICLLVIIRFWFNYRIAIIGTLLFATSSWLLTLAHQGAPLTIMVLAPMALTLCSTWFMRTKNHRFLAFLIFAIVYALACYVAYMFWIIAIVLAVLIIKERKKLFLLEPWQVIVAAGTFLTILIPMFISIMYHPGQLKELIGLPGNIGMDYLHNLLNAILNISFYGQPMPELFLGHLPFIDIFTTTMFLLGIYYFALRIDNRRTAILFTSVVVILIVIAFNKTYQLAASMLLPFIYILVAVGFVEFMNQWYSYFPRNPLARNLGLIVLTLSIGLIGFYNLQKYYAVWPYAIETKAAYMVKSNYR